MHGLSVLAFTRFASHSCRHRSALLDFRRLMATRTYAEAVECLNSLQSNAATLDAVRASGGRLSEFAIPEMIEYLERIGYKVSEATTTATPVLNA
jgi:hypothetical protein